MEGSREPGSLAPKEIQPLHSLPGLRLQSADPGTAGKGGRYVGKVHGEKKGRGTGDPPVLPFEKAGCQPGIQQWS